MEFLKQLKSAFSYCSSLLLDYHKPVKISRKQWAVGGYVNWSKASVCK